MTFLQIISFQYEKDITENFSIEILMDNSVLYNILALFLVILFH